MDQVAEFDLLELGSEVEEAFKVVFLEDLHDDGRDDGSKRSIQIVPIFLVLFLSYFVLLRFFISTLGYLLLSHEVLRDRALESLKERQLLLVDLKLSHTHCFVGCRRSGVLMFTVHLLLRKLVHSQLQKIDFEVDAVDFVVDSQLLIFFLLSDVISVNLFCFVPETINLVDESHDFRIVPTLRDGRLLHHTDVLLFLIGILIL